MVFVIHSFVFIADIHWGAKSPEILYDNLNIFLEFIKNKKPSLVVIGGDYFDYRLQLNSPSAIMSVNWFDKFIKICKESEVQRIRIIKGTQEHDNDQLEVFRSYETNDNYLKIYNTTEVEEIFPDFKCIFCPDEVINLEEYHELYYQKLLEYPSIGFFHGNFDAILPSIEFDRIQNNHLKTMIYQYDIFSKFIKGPLISGHWHVFQNYEHLYYSGSYDRWKFGEEEDKGFLYGEYDTSDNTYYITRVINNHAKKYDTIIVEDSNFRTPIEFADLKDLVDTKLLSDENLDLRIVYIITEENDEVSLNISNFQKKYSKEKRVKIDIKNIYKKEKKKEIREHKQIEYNKYSYVFNKNESVANKIHQFILDKKGIDIPIDEIQKKIENYIK